MKNLSFKRNFIRALQGIGINYNMNLKFLGCIN